MDPSKPPDFFSPQVSRARRFYLDLAPTPCAALVVVCGGCEQSDVDYEIHRDTFPYYSIEFVARGQGWLKLGTVEHQLLPGSIFTYGPGIAQHIVTDQRAPLLKYFVDFTGSDASGLLQHHDLSPGSTARVYALSDLEAVFESLVRDGCRATGFATELCGSLLRYLVLKIAESRVPGHTGQTPALATYQRCRQYIVDHCNSLMSLEQVARECLVDRAYLCRLFRRYDHQTPHQFLMRRKMHVAAELLQQPDVLVKQVAAQLGFQDPFHFSRAFKRVLGLSPEAFRRQHR
jgi:AraC-like DNA-binding protein